MFASIFSQYPYLSLALVSFLINIPFGYIRENSLKFSFKWFLWIHASIPLIIYLRITLGTSKLFIPVCIALAIAGQILGSRLRRKQMTHADREKLEQIPDLNFPKNKSVHPPDHEIMVVLMNMGGPENPQEVKPFLKRLFSDSRIIRVPFSSVLQPIFSWLIVTLRWRVTQKRYSLIGGGSPILKSSLAQVKSLAVELKKRGRDLDVTLNFNYSRPLPEDTIAEVKKAGKKYILPVSLYPHYSENTTGSNLYYLTAAAQKIYPEVIFLKTDSYYLHDAYINAFIDRIGEQLKSGESLDDFYLLFSAHGLPLYCLTEGDPYSYQINQTVSRILDRLSRKNRWALAYQSAVGPFMWLRPYTEEMIKALARKGERKILIVPIAFVTDHIETTCEIDIEYRQVAVDAGVKDFRMSKALECHPGFVEALADCVESSLPKITGKNNNIVGYKILYPCVNEEETMTTSRIIFIAYALFLFFGAFMGWKAGSKMSLIMGLASGILVLIGIYVMGVNLKGGLTMLAVIGGILAIVFLMRLIKTHSFMPAGALLIVSLAFGVYCTSLLLKH